jgi:hypothetical protein
LFYRVTVESGADAGKRNREDVICSGDLETAPVAQTQKLGLAMFASSPNRTDGVNDVLCGQTVAASELGIARLAPAEGAALA